MSHILLGFERRPSKQGRVRRSSPLALTIDRVHAAMRLRDHHLPQWRAANVALIKLRAVLPDFSVETNLIKVATLNTLYGTNLQATYRMAEHITNLLVRSPLGDTVSTVERIAAISILPGEVKRTHRSFASKFAHFFIDENRFPILDRAACDALKLHLGTQAIAGADKSYAVFLAAVGRLRCEYDVRVPDRELDCYLWIAGMWLRFARGDREINRDLLTLFTRQPQPAELEMITRSLQA